MPMGSKTYLPEVKKIPRRWVLIDLQGKVLGRAASHIANVLRGKDKAYFTPNFDCGDFVVAINAAKIRLTGSKLEKKMYYNHSGFMGGLTEYTAEELLNRTPIDLIRRAVSGMLQKNNSRKHFMRKLKIYPGAAHPHKAQIATKTAKAS